MVIIEGENCLKEDEVYIYFDKGSFEFVNVEVKYVVRSTGCPAKVNILN